MSSQHNRCQLSVASYRPAYLPATGNRLLTTILLLLLTACGFQPMYGDNAMGLGPDSPLRGNMAIEGIGTDHAGQILKAALEDRFNPEGTRVAQPEYHLRIELHQSITPSIVRSDGTILRYQVRYDSSFRLTKTGAKKELYSGELRRLGSYNDIPNDNFTDYEAQQDIIGRILTELAEDYVLRITGYFAGKQ